jgi:hypothetical protein
MCWFGLAHCSLSRLGSNRKRSLLYVVVFHRTSYSGALQCWHTFNNKYSQRIRNIDIVTLTARMTIDDDVGGQRFGVLDDDDDDHFDHLHTPCQRRLVRDVVRFGNQFVCKDELSPLYNFCYSSRY